MECGLKLVAAGWQDASSPGLGMLVEPRYTSKRGQTVSSASRTAQYVSYFS